MLSLLNMPTIRIRRSSATYLNQSEHHLAWTGRTRVVAVVAVVAAQMIRCLCGWSGRGWMVARTMHGAVLHAFYLEASGLSVMHSSVARRDPQWQGGEWARGGARGTPAVD